MDTLYIRRSINGKTFVASLDPDFKGLAGRKCPITGAGFESQVKEVNADKAEIMGLNFEEALDAVHKEGLFFGRFKINLGDTLIIE